MSAQLTSISDVQVDAHALVQLPKYLPENHGVGMVHVGVGAFHRSHQAVMTDDALAIGGGDWRITGVALRSKASAEQLNAQNGLYTVLIRGGSETTARIVASIDHVIAADAAKALAALTHASVRVVTLTVTEAGYGIDRQTRLPDINNPIVASDVAAPENSQGVLGLLVEAIRVRHEAGFVPFTVLSCDNLPANGKLLRDGVIGFAQLSYGDNLADWIAENIAFPCCMVDRITPAPNENTYKDARRLIACEDKAAVETEPFIQWIIEDNFPSGRPKWEAGGATFVSDVDPYERMKLTMLNGCHSMLAYSGYLCAKTYVRDVMQDELLSTLVGNHFVAAASLLKPLPGIDYNDYALALTQRFNNPSIAHETFQIASDGTEKLPQRIFQPALEALRVGQDLRPFAFCTAMWMRFTLKQLDDGTPYELNDPRAQEITNAVNGKVRDVEKISAALHNLSDFIPKDLSLNDSWRGQISEVLGIALRDSCESAVKHEAARISSLK
jgi:fructuronate reductase